MGIEKIEETEEECFKKNISDVIFKGNKVGVKINIIYPNGKNGVKQFLYKKYNFPYLDAIKWIKENPNNTPFWRKYLIKRGHINNICPRPNIYNKKEFDLDKLKTEVFEKFNISSFPSKIGDLKIIDIDYNKTHWTKVAVCECSICKKHFNTQLSKILKHSGKCGSCVKVSENPVNIKIVKQTEAYIEYKLISSVTINTTYKLEQPFSIIKKLKVNNSENINLNEIINSILFLRDRIIKKYNLKYKLSLSKSIFSQFEKLPEENFKDYQVNIKEKLIDNLKLIRKVHHIFKAKIEGFGIHKSSGNKTILLKEVEYIGIDNFRDHLWTEFTEELNLPIGTTIKFKGEIYDYERDYKGNKIGQKDGQSIKVVKLLEVDISTRVRTKLYK
jgi:hypothetical protein